MEPPSLRINTLKTSRSRFGGKLTAWQITASPHPFHPDGLILADDPLPLSHTLAFFRGEFFYQGISSQLPVIALDPQPGETILDMCAAPGSKSTQIAAAMANQGRLWINDASTKRLQALMANLTAAGVMNDIVTALPGQLIGRLLPEQFDRILVDAPCSALSNWPKRIKEAHWSPAYLNKISYLQEQLLISAIKAARVGGIIVYSTCSICPEEDEMVLERILARYPVEMEPLPFSPAPFVRPGLSGYAGHSFARQIECAGRVHPYPLPYEGFFVARLRKTGPLPIRPVTTPLQYQPTLAADAPEIAAILSHLHDHWGIDPAVLQNYRFIVNKNRIWMMDSAWEQTPDRTFMMAGLPLALRKSHAWRLLNQSVQFLDAQVSKRHLELSDQDLLALFEHGHIPAPHGPLSYHALTLGGRPIAALAQADGCFSIHLPHHFHIRPETLAAERGL